MAKIMQKLETLEQVLVTLNSSIELFKEYELAIVKTSNKRDLLIFLGLRDSVIQRFEYCTDLFWKVLKLYLEEVEKLDLPTYSPRSVIRESVKAKIISEKQGADCMDMVISRNKTSHIYHEQIAEDIVHQVPGFYALMKSIVDAIKQNMKSI